MAKAQRELACMPNAYSVPRQAANGCCAAGQTTKDDGLPHEQAKGLLHNFFAAFEGSDY
jgi:hypothetical protein